MSRREHCSTLLYHKYKSPKREKIISEFLQNLNDRCCENIAEHSVTSSLNSFHRILRRVWNSMAALFRTDLCYL